MKILLLSRNRVVREMVRLAAREAGAELESVGAITEVEGDRYDLLLMDASSSEERSFEALQEHLLVARKGVIASEENGIYEGFDFTVSKPFLPSDILRIIRESTHSEAASEAKEMSLGAFLSDREEPGQGEAEEMPTHVLDGEEISKIRTLLEETEEGSRSGIGATSSEPEHREVETEQDVEEWIDRLFSMKPKRLKKLLKGAEVTITIRFPGEKR